MDWGKGIVIKRKEINKSNSAVDEDGGERVVQSVIQARLRRERERERERVRERERERERQREVLEGGAT